MIYGNSSYQNKVVRDTIGMMLPRRTFGERWRADLSVDNVIVHFFIALFEFPPSRFLRRPSCRSSLPLPPSASPLVLACRASLSPLVRPLPSSTASQRDAAAELRRDRRHDARLQRPRWRALCGHGDSILAAMPSIRRNHMFAYFDCTGVRHRAALRKCRARYHSAQPRRLAFVPRCSGRARCAGSVCIHFLGG